SGGGRLRRRVSAALRPADSPFAGIGSALRAAIAGMAGDQVGSALARLADRWGSHPAAASVGATTVDSLPAEFAGQADRAVVDWLDAIEARLELPAEPAPMSSRWHPVTLAVATLAVNAPTETAEAPGSIASRILTERSGSAVLPAWRDLLQRPETLVGQEQNRSAALLDNTQVSRGSVPALRASPESLQQLKAELPDSVPG
ncbi:MAG TPA: hypothetical protein VHN80_22405, partial [Kineosporiaceae bacterium]|nr:hypothetical protein [Kineosporiaceae bacterium]